MPIPVFREPAQRVPGPRVPRSLLKSVRASFAAPVFALAALLGACGPSGQQAGGTAIVANSPAAIVNGEVIYADDVQIAAERLGYVDKGERLEVDSAEFDKVLARLIDVRLMAQAALGKSLDAERVARWDLQWMRDSKLANLLIDDAMLSQVDEAEIRKVYERQVAIFNQGGALGEEWRVRRIVVATQAEADAVVRQVQSGAEFAVVASQKSLDQQTRLDGGDLGFLTEERAGPELARVMKATTAGSVSRPFQVQGGWAVIKVEEKRREQAPSLERMRPEIEAYLRTVQTDRLLRELYASAKIERKTSPANSAIETDPFSLAPGEAPRPQPTTTTPAVPSLEASGPSPTPRASPAPAATTPAPAASPSRAATPSPAPVPASPRPSPTATPPPAPGGGSP